MEQVFNVMKRTFGETYGGLQSTGLGCFKEGQSMPRFNAVGVNRRFIQILNVGDHWICASNAFGESSHDVFIFDSMIHNLSKSVIAQVTSLLRAEDDPDSIKFHIRPYGRQTEETRICGFYAVAAAFSCSLQVDPTGYIMDELMMKQHLQQCLVSEIVLPFPGIKTNPPRYTVQEVPKLHCMCQAPSRNTMVQCTNCLNWFHKDCVEVRQTLIRQPEVEWLGPCCDKGTSSDEDIVRII